MVSDSKGAGNPRPEKVAVVDDVRRRMSASSGALLTEYRGLTVGELAGLRKAVNEAGGEYRVYKNTLARIAANELGVSGLDPLLTGPTAFAFISGDAVAVARSLRDFARTNPKLVVKGGLLGDRILSAADTAALADVAPREVQLAWLAGALAAPLRQMAALLGAVPTNFAYGLAALIDQRGGSSVPVVSPTAVPSDTGLDDTSPEEPNPAETAPAETAPAQTAPAQTGASATDASETPPSPTETKAATETEKES